MKKALLIGMALLFCVGIYDANANKTVSLINRPSTNPVDDDTLITSDPVDTRNYKKMSFFMNYDEEQTSAVYGTFTVEVSWDKAEWFTTRLYTFDSSLVDIPDTSIVKTADSKLVAFFDTKVMAPWTRVKFQPTGASAAIGDYVYVTVEFIGVE